MKYFLIVLTFLFIGTNLSASREVLEEIETKFQNRFPAETLMDKKQWYEGMGLTRDKFHTLLNHQAVKGVEDQNSILRVLIGCTVKVTEQKELMNYVRPILDQLKIQPLRSPLTTQELITLWYMHQGDLSPKSNYKVYQGVIDLCAHIAQSSPAKAFYWRHIWEHLNMEEMNLDVTKDMLKAWHGLSEDKAIALGQSTNPWKFFAIKPFYFVSLLEQYKYASLDVFDRR